MGGIWLVDGRELKAVTEIDDHSRFCVMALIERANGSVPTRPEVLFDRICRTTGKIEQFHKTLRADLLTGRRFDTLAHALGA